MFYSIAKPMFKQDVIPKAIPPRSSKVAQLALETVFGVSTLQLDVTVQGLSAFIEATAVHTHKHIYERANKGFITSTDSLLMLIQFI